MICRNLTLRTFRLCRALSRLIAVVVVLLLAAFIYLRLHGVPEPILRSVVSRVNAAGIPVDIGSMELTLRGWRAGHVEYYSRHPDDLKPLFVVRQVLFDRVRQPEGSMGWKFNVAASDITINPSVEWGVEVPPESGCRTMERGRLTVAFLPDRITITNGEASWMGINFELNGTFLKRPKDAPERPRKQTTVLPEYIDMQEFRTLEKRLQALSVEGAATVAADLFIDAGDFSRNRIGFSAEVEDLSLLGVHFSGAGLTGQYDSSGITVQDAALYRANRALEVAGRYDLVSHQISGQITNAIVSVELLRMLPPKVSDLLGSLGLEFSVLPRFTAEFGPALAGGLLNTLSARFDLDHLSFQSLEGESIRGRVAYRNNRLEISELSGSVIGQESRASQTGSGMVGGPVEGSVFWDFKEHRFGVAASGSFDPNLLVRPLEISRVATNVLHRFRFGDHPPQVTHLALGADVDDWHTFYLDIQGMGNHVFFHDVDFSSVNASAHYTNGVLRLDPVAAMQGADFIKGTASLDFHTSEAGFDAFGSLNPAAIEALVYPGSRIFSNSVIARGSTRIKARGVVDWDDMLTTRFDAEVEADRLKLPMAELDQFKASVVGKGPDISVVDARYGFCGGRGEADFSIRLDPATNRMPYRIHTAIEQVDVQRCLRFFNPDVEYSATGILKCTADVEADMTRKFWDTAKGAGRIDVDHGQLADLPLFSGFSYLMRKVIPSFDVFTITSLRGTFSLGNGRLRSNDAHFGGDLISARADGTWSPVDGLNALVTVEVLKNKGLAKIVRVVTDPLMKLLEIELTGSLQDPSWKLKKLSPDWLTGSRGQESGKTD